MDSSQTPSHDVFPPPTGQPAPQPVTAPQPLQGLGDAVRAVAAKPARETYWLDVPARIAETTSVRKIGMVEINASEELMAAKRAGTNLIQLASEQAKESLRFVNDQPVNTGNGSVDVFWASERKHMSALRALIVSAYGVIHQPEAQEAAAFLGSLRTG